MNKNTRRITFTSMMISLSVILSYIKIPLYQTTSLDSLPGFFTAIFVNPLLGGTIALIGHLVTSLINGFPLTILGHIIISLSMFVAAYLFGTLFNNKKRWTLIIAFIIATICNVYLSLPFLNILCSIPYSMLLPLQIPLLIASSVNISLSIVLYFTLTRGGYQIQF
jgi:riboflavin transporter FmnP